MSRKHFAALMEAEMAVRSEIRFVTADLGFGVLDSLRRNFPDRSYNTGAAEQLMLGLGIGLAENGLIPVLYSITPFLLYRPFEYLRTYVNHEGIPVKLVGVGRDKDYDHDGMSHWAHDDEAILAALPNIRIYKPNSDAELSALMPEFLGSKQPCYLNLTRF